MDLTPLVGRHLRATLVLAAAASLLAFFAVDAQEAHPQRTGAVQVRPTPRPTPQRWRPASPPPPAQRDEDGDGHVNQALGGDDCDDRDANRYPGNAEVCDTAHHDEDCNPLTYGERDADRDGYPDARCCNRHAGRELSCGSDCDDANAVIHPDAQVCSRSAGFVLICHPRAGGARPGADRDSQGEYYSSPEGPPWERVACAGGGGCAVQPNGTGVCVP